MSEKEDKKYFGLNDAVIFQVRELIQLAMLTETNLVDHLRQLRFEESTETPGLLSLTPEYVQYHNNVVEGLSGPGPLPRGAGGAAVGGPAAAGPTRSPATAE